MATLTTTMRSLGGRSIAVIATLFVISIFSAPVRADYGGLVHDDMNSPLVDRENLTVEQAREYLLSLINKDRASLNLKPVVLDEAGTRAAQSHSDDMATKGYLSHWNFEGKDPFQRYTESGGKDWDMENVYFDAVNESSGTGALVEIPLVTGPIFHRPEIEKMETSFFGEKPPYDGHRKNIIDPDHTGVGIGLSAASKLGVGMRMACDQEFINKYGEYADIPQSIKTGDRFTISGKLVKGFKLFNVDILRGELPQPMDLQSLSRQRAYGPPEDRIVTYFPAPLPSPAPLMTKETDSGLEFSVEAATDTWRPGIYLVSIWITHEDKPKEPFLASGRIVVIPAEK